MGNSNNISWRHHYIPQFYLNGFTSDEGKFKIYDVEKKSIVKSGQNFSTRAYFFEKNSNTVSNEIGTDDFIESAYKEMDDKVAKVFERINNPSTENKCNLTDDDIALLQYFVGLMYWRIPSNYQEIREIVNKKELKTLGLKIYDSNIEQRLKNDENFVKVMKFWFPNISFPELFSCKTPLHVVSFPKGLPSICSDNPIICRNPETFRVYNDDFIFPLNSDTLFIRGNERAECMTTVKVEIDLLIYKQAKKYVSCTDIRYLEMLDGLYEKYNDLDYIRASIFNQLLK